MPETPDVTIRFSCDRQPRTAAPETPDPIVTVTRYTVSLFPVSDRDHRHFVLHVELKPRGWVVTDGAGYYGPDDAWEASVSTAHHFADHEEAVALAKTLAPALNVNGHTAAEVYHHTREQG
jgi:hypothetical protein